MKSQLFKLSLLGIALLLSLAPMRAAAAENDHNHTHEQCLSPSMVKLKGDMRKLWIDHVLWTRSYIVSNLAGLLDQEQVLARLLKNQQDIGNAIKPYYGEAAGNRLVGLLTEHIAIAGKIVNAAKSGNQADFEKFNKEWYKNADDIAKFLSSANPNWTHKQLKDLLDRHLQLLAENVAARLAKNWEADIIAFDQGEDHIILLADTLTEGIVKQFPDRFR
jgi:REP element-mobilizing transposase RayT